MSCVVCIEGNEWLLQDMTEALKEAGHEVVPLLNGSEAIDSISDLNPELIIADLELPDMAGIELIKKVRQECPKLADVPFIAVTEQSDRDEVLGALSDGADECLTKPVDFKVLSAKVAAMLRQVERMNEKKRGEHVRLYKALTNMALNTVEPASCSGSVALIGVMSTSMQELRSELERRGCRVTVFESGQRFIDLLEELSVDTVITSYFTSDIQGEFVVRAVMRSKKNAHLPVVLAWPTERGRMPDQLESETECDEVVVLPTLDIGERLETWIRSDRSTDNCTRVAAG